VLASIEEERARQCAGDGAADAVLEAPVLHRFVVILQQFVDVVRADRAPYARFASVATIVLAQSRSCARQTKMRSRLGVALRPLTSNGPAAGTS
jgi:hypothetical protein